MKRILATIMALVLCAGAFSGCSGDTGNAASAGSSEAGSVASTDETGDASGEEAALSGELTYWTYTDSTTNLVNEFAKVNPRYQDQFAGVRRRRVQDEASDHDSVRPGYPGSV